MHNLSVYEECFKKFTNSMSQWAPESLVPVNLNLLQRFGLLDYHHRPIVDPGLTRYFQVIETVEKITLINEEFVAWIVPAKLQESAATYVLIALNAPQEPLLEVAFYTSGVYNTSHLVLRVLEKFLHEIQENEEYIKLLKKSEEDK